MTSFATRHGGLHLAWNGCNACLLAFSIAIIGQAPAQTDQSLVQRAELLDLRVGPRCVEARVRSADSVDRDTAELVVVTADARPLGRLSFVRADSTGWTYEGPSALPGPASASTSHPSHTAANCQARWLDLSGLRLALADTGVIGEYFASINAVGPGQECVWLDHGAEQGARPGDTWWLRVNGQPAARFETLVVTQQLSFARTTLLASDVSIRPGQRIAIWPMPMDEHLGHARSAVARTELRESLCIAWIARPPGPALPADSHVEFKRAGEVVALGAVEHSDALFTYVRVIARFAELPPSARADQRAIACPLLVGDIAEIRTPSDIEAGRFIIRIFAAPSGGSLINAGEPEGLQTGITGDVLRKGQRVGAARIERVQTGYSVLRYEHEPLPGDTFQLHSAPPRERMLGRVETIFDERLLQIRCEQGITLQSGQLLTIYTAGEPAAVAVLLEVQGDLATAATLAPTIARPVLAGAAVAGL